jgi:hypothetical protein
MTPYCRGNLPLNFMNLTVPVLAAPATGKDDPLPTVATGKFLSMKFKRNRYHRMFEVRHLINYTPSHARLAFSRL